MEKLKNFVQRSKNVLMIALAIIIELIMFWKQSPMLLMNILLFFVVVVFGIIEFQYKKKTNNLVESSSNKSDFFAAVITVGITALISNVFYMNKLELPDIRLYLVIAWAVFIVIALLGYIIDKIYFLISEKRNPSANANTPSVGQTMSQNSEQSNVDKSIDNQNKSSTTNQSGSKPKNLDAFTRFKIFLCAVFPIFILIIFLILPLLPAKENIELWFANASALSIILSGSEETLKNNGLISYICCFIVGTVILIVFFMTLYNIAHDRIVLKRKGSIFSSNEYSSSIIILVTCIAAVSLFFDVSSDSEGWDLVKEAGSSSLKTIFMILLAMTLIEIVHLALNQGTRSNSLLRISIRYIFILVVKCFMDIIIGILSNLHLRDILSSIFSTSINIGKTNIFDIVAAKIDSAIDNEIQQVSSVSSKASKKVRNNSRISTRRQIK